MAQEQGEGSQSRAVTKRQRSERPDQAVELVVDVQLVEEREEEGARPRETGHALRQVAEHVRPHVTTPVEDRRVLMRAGPVCVGPSRTWDSVAHDRHLRLRAAWALRAEATACATASRGGMVDVACPDARQLWMGAAGPGVERRRTRVSGPWSRGGWRRDRARIVRPARAYAGSIA